MFNIPEELLTLPQREAKKRARDWRAEEALKNAKPFGQIKPVLRGKKDVGIIAASFLEEIDNPLEEIFPNVKPAPPTRGDLIDPSGTLSYSKSLLPRGIGLQITASYSLWDTGGMAYFTEDIGIPVLRFTKGARPHVSGWGVWMSLTPMEVWSQRSGIQAATGHVVLGGLGMGWLLRSIAKKPSVTKITVIEKDKNLLEWFGYELCKKTPKVDEVICGDFFEEARRFDLKKARFIVDIWPTVGGADNDRRLHLMRYKNPGAKIWAWGCARMTASNNAWARRLAEEGDDW